MWQNPKNLDNKKLNNQFKFLQKPLFTLMFDELKFAIKCGGSAKKLQLTTHAEPAEACSSSQMNKKSNSTGNLGKSNSLTKYRKEGQKSDSNFSKHEAVSYMSSSNPGLLIVEKETALDAHNSLLNAHVLPHMTSHHQSKQYCSNQALNYSNKKYSKKKHRNHEKPVDSDYILMRPMSSSKLNLNSQSRINGYTLNSSDNNHNIPINIENDLYMNQEFNHHEQQINYDRYLSKSNIMKNQAGRSNRHWSGSILLGRSMNNVQVFLLI